ncbi:MAG: hypothetical protein ACTSQS_18910 [Promethearchaeota archaeon]
MKSKFVYKKEFIIFFILFTLGIILIISENDIPINPEENNRKGNLDKQFSPKTSAVIGWLNLTNQEINNTRHYHGTNISIIGRIFDPISKAPKVNYNVTLKVDNVYDYSYSDTTNFSGYFKIEYTIPFSMDVFSPHRFEVNVTDDLGNNYVEIKNHYIIYVNATSYFSINWGASSNLKIPYLPGEEIVLNGWLRMDNGNGIIGATVNKYFFNSTRYTWSLGSFITAGAGAFPNNPIDNRFTIPDTPSMNVSIKLNYSGQVPEINTSEIIIPNIKVFRNMSCTWNVVSSATEGDEVVIQGQLVSQKYPNLKLNDRQIDIFYDGVLIATLTTDANGEFKYTYTIPSGSGVKQIEISLVNNLGLDLRSQTSITIEAASVENRPPASTGADEPTIFDFLIVFILIVSGIIAALVIYGYYYYKKQEKESMIVELPLENKLRNLKILKDTGRLEESLSYLFNAVYMELVSAKFGRTKKPNETIRDFAITSVKEFKLNPSTIYPFIQKLEEVIYARPTMTEKDFYEVVNLFSPVYYELTGYNFVLNF